MNKRMKILFTQDYNTHPSFTTSELSELFGVSQKKIKTRAKAEGWQSFEQKEVGEDGKIDSYPVWDALSMPETTRQQIAFAHYAAEEEEQPLLKEAEADASQILFHFSGTVFSVIHAAIYRARQFSMIQDAALSLRLSIYDSTQAISQVYGMEPEFFLDLERVFSRSIPGAFYLMNKEVRLLMLVNHFSNYPNEFLPEFISDDVKKEKWN